MIPADEDPRHRDGKCISATSGLVVTLRSRSLATAGAALSMALMVGCGGGGGGETTPSKTVGGRSEKPLVATVTVRAVVSGKTPGDFADTTEAHKGDVVQIRVSVRGRKGAPPESVRITVPRKAGAKL